MPEMTPEQQEELKKKLENMNPEELREFQKKQCIFCHIVSGKVQAKKIFEDNKILAILDINPANPGHVLLLPKEHYMIMPQLPEELLQHIYIIARQLSNALLRALDVRGTNIIVANGAAAGQRANHFMIHIIPRKEEDGLNFILPSNKYSESDLENVAQRVRQKLNQVLGIKQEQIAPKQDATKQDTKEKAIEPTIEPELPLEQPVPEPDLEETVDQGEEIQDEVPNIEEAEPEVIEEKQKKKKKVDTAETMEKPEESDDIDLDDIGRVLNG